MRRIIIAVLLAVLTAAALVGGVALAGKLARDHLRSQKSHTIQVEDIDLNPPPDEERELFLAEMQYDCGLEDEINLFDDDLKLRLVQAFLRHPRVETVERVSIGPGKRLRIELRYRVPVLAVPIDGVTRTIDVHGILLPPGVPTTGLLVLRDTQLPPLVESGNMWADARMRCAARTADFLRADSSKLGLTGISAASDGAITLWTSAGTAIRWGKAPGDEGDGEPVASQKLERLQEHIERHGDLDHPSGMKEIDLN